ncbi:MAG TPA: type II toxin-antitoxin system VapC family toxin [Polyangia bacterium]|nr:type II toxin-antitoxin system VapC family toxin [Polyangia bacterium]
MLVRLLTGDDTKQVASAEAFLGRVGSAWISHIVLVETVWVLESVYGRDRGQITSALTTLLDHRSFVLQDVDIVQAALDLFRTRRSLGFSDYLVLETARRAGHLPLATFDRALGAVDGAERI